MDYRTEEENRQLDRAIFVLRKHIKRDPTVVRRLVAGTSKELVAKILQEQSKMLQEMLAVTRALAAASQALADEEARTKSAANNQTPAEDTHA